MSVFKKSKDDLFVGMLHSVSTCVKDTMSSIGEHLQRIESNITELSNALSPEEKTPYEKHEFCRHVDCREYTWPKGVRRCDTQCKLSAYAFHDYLTKQGFKIERITDKNIKEFEG